MKELTGRGLLNHQVPVRGDEGLDLASGLEEDVGLRVTIPPG